MVFSYGAIEHFGETQKAINEFHRVLKKGGSCLITVPNPYNFHSIVGKHVMRLVNDSRMGFCGFEKTYTPNQLRKMIERAGFSIVDTGVLRQGFGCVFGCFWPAIPVVGKPIYAMLDKLSIGWHGIQKFSGGATFGVAVK